MAPILAPGARGLGQWGAASRGELLEKLRLVAGRPGAGERADMLATTGRTHNFVKVRDSDMLKTPQGGARAAALPPGVWGQGPARPWPTYVFRLQ